MTVAVGGERGNGNSIRQELWRIEDRLAGDIRDLKTGLDRFVTEHAADHSKIMDDHAARRAATDQRFSDMDDAIQGDALQNAKREGALGVFRFVVTVLAKNWPLVLAIIGGLLAITNNLHVSFT